LIRYRAAWVVPVAGPPVRDGWIAVDQGLIAATGRGVSGGAPEIDLGDVAVLPGLVNAHTHLELSYLRDQVPPAREFVAWIRGVMAARRGQPDPASPLILDAVDQAIAEAEASGTALVGDISNTLVTWDPLRRSSMGGVVFSELIRFNPADAESLVADACRRLRLLAPSDRLRSALAAHAPYSVAPLVFRAIRRAADREALTPCSVHLSESVEEVEFLRTGGGPWRSLLEDVGAWDPEWTPPGVSPVRFLDEAGFLDGRTVAVHGVQMTAEDLRVLRAHGTTLVTCPLSNGHTGAGAPPLADFYDAGLNVAVGTDSLASAPDLNLFAELATMHALAPGVPPRALLDSATRAGAAALGFEGTYGTIEPGARASLLAVALPASTDDVEEYLVSGVGPDQVRWVERQ